MSCGGVSTQDYVSDGLTEEMITQFGRMDPQQLGVIARTSAMAYKETRKTTADIGRELGVDYLLEGSVRRDASRVRVSAQLVQVKDQTHLWAQNYDRDMRDILNLQDEVARSIAAEIRVKLANQPGSLPARNRPVDVEAYEIYLRGLYYWNRRSQADLQRGIAYFQQAIERDPNHCHFHWKSLLLRRTERRSDSPIQKSPRFRSFISSGTQLSDQFS
jgi:TolB-like protein